MIRKFLIAMAAALPIAASAGTVSSNGHRVEAVMSGYEHKGMFIETLSDLPNPNNCSNWNTGSKRIIAAIPSRSEVDHVLSLALAAKFSQGAVDILVYDDICFENWPVLRRIKVK